MEPLQKLTKANPDQVRDAYHSKNKDKIAALCDWSSLNIADFTEYVNATKDDSTSGIDLVLDIIFNSVPDDDNKVHKELREQSIFNLARAYTKANRFDDVMNLSTRVLAFIEKLPQARAAKIIRTLIDRVCDVYELSIVEGLTRQVTDALKKCCNDLCEKTYEWAKQPGRQFLAQRVRMKSCFLLVISKEYAKATEACEPILRELRQLDDKSMLLELAMIETKAFRGISNIPRAKASLTTARTFANAIYCPPLVASELDTLSGMVNLDENDPKTAFSYFYEAFESYASLGDHTRAEILLKYMILSKLMSNDLHEIQPLVTTKTTSQYANSRHVRALLNTAEAFKERSLEKFDKVRAEFPKEINDDDVIAGRLSDLYESILEQNLLRVLEPYSRVQISRVSELVNIEPKRVQETISRMILDGKLRAIIDQTSETISIFEEERLDNTYADTLSLIEKMLVVVDLLNEKAQKVDNE